MREFFWSRHRLLSCDRERVRKKIPCRDIFCVTIEGRGNKELYVATGFFRVTTERYVGCGNLFAMRKFYVTTECGQMERFCVAIRNFMSRQSLVMGGGSHVAT